MNMNLCQKCNESLNKSQYRTNAGGEYKSCPNCSSNNGKEHVYYKYPVCFGITDKRSSSEHPDGPQSHCTTCRFKKSWSVVGKLCTEL